MLFVRRRRRSKRVRNPPIRSILGNAKSTDNGTPCIGGCGKLRQRQAGGHADLPVSVIKDTALQNRLEGFSGPGQRHDRRASHSA